MASNANLFAKSYDRERDLKFAAEAALAIGKSRVNADPSILTMRSVGQVDTAILSGWTITGADGLPLSGIKVNVYVGPSGSTSGQFGRFSSIVAEARDQRGNGFIRRLELTQESFAKFAYWSNVESNNGSTILFNWGDQLWGPVWSNDTIGIGSNGASFHDDVGTAAFITGKNFGTFSKGYKEYQKPIPMPSLSVLSTLKPIAAGSGWDFTSGRAGSQTASSVLDRIEFIADDLNNSGDATDLNEGMFRIYTARSSDAVLRGNFESTTAANNHFCGDYHMARVNNVAGTATMQFYPASVHNTSWFNAQMKQGLIDGGMTSTLATTKANAEQTASLQTIMVTNGRCFLPGDAHLVAVERSSAYTDPFTGLGYATAAIQKGGMDTTFTPAGVYGSWKQNTTTPDSVITRVRGYSTVGVAVGAGRVGDAQYVYPIDRQWNALAKGVIHFSGNVGISGTVNGRITLYANGSIMILDDLRYSNDPVTGVCRDILGLISDKDIVIADNAENTPQKVGSITMTVDDTKDVYIQGVLMAIGTSFRVENWGSGPTSGNNCLGAVAGRGCIYLAGGIIQQSRGPVGSSSGAGFGKQYSYDHCAVVNPPPYFPTTGRFQDNRYLELDPAGFDHTAYYKSITPNP